MYSIDLIPDISPLSSQGNSQIIVAVDNFNKFVLIGALPNRQAITITNWFLKNIIGILGWPVMVKSDNGSEFKGIFSEVLEELGVTHATISPHHPQANGVAERFVRTIKSYLVRRLVGTNRELWEE